MQSLTAREVIDNARFGMRAQNYIPSKSSINRGSAYRGKDGRKCAIGFSIPDEVYNRSYLRVIDHTGVDIWEIMHFSNRYPEIAALFKDVDMDLLIALQAAHDSIVFDPSDKDNDRLRQEYFEEKMQRLEELYLTPGA